MAWWNNLRQSFRAKILLLYALLWSVLFTGTGLVVYQLIRHDLEKRMGRQFVAVGRWIAGQLEGQVPAGLKRGLAEPGRFAAFSRRLKGYTRGGVFENISILDAKGLVLLDATGEAPAGFPSPQLNAAGLAALRQGQAEVLPVYRGGFGLLHQSVLLPLKPGLILQLDADPRYLDLLREFGRVSLLLGLLGLAASVGVSTLVARAVLKPTARIMQLAQDMLEGRYRAHEESQAPDELGRALKSMTVLLGRIQERESTLAQRHDDARRQAEEMREVAAGIAHEVRNPLAVIRGQADWLKRKSQGNADLLETCQKIQDQVGALNEVVERFLEYSRIPRLRPAPVELADFVGQVAGSLEDLAGREGVRLETDSQLGGAALILADTSLLAGALFNLGLNAIQAMQGKGGLLRLVLRRVQEIGVVEVEDQGPGLSEGAQARLFKPFFTTKPGGTGMGLAWADKVVQAHQGYIEACNKPEGGAVFRIFIPLLELSS